eukprot:Skav217162  [mRNA]  locus=scaffold566:124193:126350:+ [translate_table: standard]
MEALSVAGTAVLFNENLPHMAGALQQSLQEHLLLKHDRCGVAASAKREVIQALQEAKLDVEGRLVLEVPSLTEIYNSYSDYLVDCPQADIALLCLTCTTLRVRCIAMLK